MGPETAVAALTVVVLVALILLVWLQARTRRRRRPTGASAAPGVAGAARPLVTAPSSYERLRRGLTRTRSHLIGRLEPVLRRGKVDEAALEEFEAALLAADVGTVMTERLLRCLRTGHLESDGSLRELLEREMVAILEAAGGSSKEPTAKPWVIMVVGVNGVGKTTSIGKLAARYSAAGKTALLVAGDTFRAAAIEQLVIWADRAGVQLIRQQPGSDPAAVVYDGLRAAVARDVDVVIIDTAGRLHTKSNLMDELRKVRRIIAREVPGAPHETLLVLDAVTGQNGLAQARAFLENLLASGVILTKLDGTAKGGVVVAIAGELGIPVRYVGVGEAIDDLRDFDSREFARALFGAAGDNDSLDT